MTMVAAVVFLGAIALFSKKIIDMRHQNEWQFRASIRYTGHGEPSFQVLSCVNEAGPEHVIFEVLSDFYDRSAVHAFLQKHQIRTWVLGTNDFSIGEPKETIFIGFHRREQAQRILSAFRELVVNTRPFVFTQDYVPSSSL